MKKFMTFAATVTLTAAIAVSGTVAYLSSTDSDHNTMTLGNVTIEQHEYQREVGTDGEYSTDTIDNQTSYELVGFVNDKPLLPAVKDPATYPSGWDEIPVRMTQVGSYGSMSMFNEPNAVDKIVTVENKGNTDAYVRTLIAYEVGSASEKLIGYSYHFAWEENEVGRISIDGVDYHLCEYVYQGAEGYRHENGVLPAGDTTYNSLGQVYIKSEATNEDCDKLDGNDNGKLDILVLSQAVQAAGFDSAEEALNAQFGEITRTEHPWAK